jgi:hypothetical protein
VEKSKVKTLFDMSLDDGWQANFIENEDGSKIFEIGINGFYPMYMHFGRDESNERFIHVINTLRPGIHATVAQWSSLVEDNG